MKPIGALGGFLWPRLFQLQDFTHLIQSSKNFYARYTLIFK
jgi:hypothetical protein